MHSVTIVTANTKNCRAVIALPVDEGGSNEKLRVLRIWNLRNHKNVPTQSHPGRSQMLHRVASSEPEPYPFLC